MVSWFSPLPILICAIVALCLGLVAASCGGQETPTPGFDVLESPTQYRTLPISVPSLPDEYKKANPKWKEQTERAVAVALEYDYLFGRQPGASSIRIKRTYDEDGFLTGPVGIVIYVDCQVYGVREEPQYLLPGWEQIPRQIKGVPIQLWKLVGIRPDPCAE